MARHPVPIEAHSELQAELALTLQILYVLGRIEQRDFPKTIRTIGNLAEAHQNHGFVKKLMEHGVTIRSITPLDTNELTDPRKAYVYLQELSGKQTLNPAELDMLMLNAEVLQNRAIRLRELMARWRGQLVEVVRLPRPADIEVALARGAVVQVHLSDQEARLPLLLVPQSTYTCWVYDPRAWITINYPVDGVANLTTKAITIFSAP